MHITRKTNQELVIVDSSIWISVFLLCVALLVAYASIVQSKPNGLLLGGFFLLFTLLFWRREIVVFEAGRQQVEWTRRRLFKSATGTVPFSEITGIGMEASAGNGRSMTYRLTILTAQKPVPMSDNYGGNRNGYESIRTEILQFLKLDGRETQSLSGVADEASILSLLMQGRKIDAIELLRSGEKIGLTEAVNRVNKIDEKMKAAQ